MTDYLQVLILGIVQGATEWLPVSSEGVLALIQIEILGRELDHALTLAIWLHLGTLIAAVIYFRKEVLHLVPKIPQWIFQRSNMDEKDRLIADFLAIATLMTAIVGVPLFLLSLEAQFVGNVATGVIGALLIGTGLFQLFASSLGRRNQESLKPLDGLIAGLVQGLAVLPGFSRSGLTVATLLIRGFEESEAIRLSFLMSIPVIFGAQFLLQLLEQRDGVMQLDPTNAAIGVVSSALVGWMTIAALIKIARRLPFWAFAISLGVLSLAAAFVL